MQLLWKIHLEPKITRSNKKINGIVVQEQQEKKWRMNVPFATCCQRLC